MGLPGDFQFSQHSLQDYVDCPRRFQLRYILQVDWPALEAEPALENERRMQQGADFHRLIHRHLRGIPVEDLTRSVQGADLPRWWERWQKYWDWAQGPQGLPEVRYPEVVLSSPLGGYRLTAALDLIAVDAGRKAVVVDWKTSRRRPRREFLAERLQTRVYPFLLVEAGAHLNDGRPLEPEQVEMVYWFADYPDEPACFPYDTARCEKDRDGLESLVAEIAGRRDEVFPLTAEERRCGFCLYRSLCERGVKAGSLDEVEDELEPQDGLDLSTLDFEQIAEIAY